MACLHTLIIYHWNKQRQVKIQDGADALYMCHTPWSFFRQFRSNLCPIFDVPLQLRPLQAYLDIDIKNVKTCTLICNRCNPEPLKWPLRAPVKLCAVQKVACRCCRKKVNWIACASFITARALNKCMSVYSNETEQESFLICASVCWENLQ